MPAHLMEIFFFHGEFDGSNQGRGWNRAEGILRHTGDIDHQSDSSSRPDVGRSTSAGDPGQKIPDRTGQTDRIFGHSGPETASCSCHEDHTCQGRFTVFPDPFDHRLQHCRHFLLNRFQFIIQHIKRGIFSGGAHHQQS